MHHGTEMSSVSLLIRLSSITPTLPADRDEEEEEEEEGSLGRKKKKTAKKREINMRKTAKKMMYKMWLAEDLL